MTMTFWPHWQLSYDYDPLTKVNNNFDPPEHMWCKQK